MQSRMSRVFLGYPIKNVVLPQQHCLQSITYQGTQYVGQYLSARASLQQLKELHRHIVDQLPSLPTSEPKLMCQIFLG